MCRILLLFCLLTIQLFSLSAQYAGKLGINLGGGLGDFFVDIAKTTRNWEATSGGTLAPNQLDAKGWPMQDFRTVLMDHRPVPEWGGTIDDPQEYRVDYSGTYAGSFSGQASVSASGDATIQNLQYNASDNISTFDLVVGSPGSNHSLVILTFTNTRRTSGSSTHTGITDLRVIRPGYANRPDQVFTDAFMQTLTAVDFAAIRSQNFTGTTSWDISFPNEVNWANRKQPDDAIQGSGFGDKRESAAWEYFIQLCNQVQMDIWIDVPISASTDYVTQLAQLLKDSLDANLNIYVENDNEVWNSAPAFVGTYHYNQAEAGNLGFTPEQNIARRAVELAQIFATVFDTSAINDRVRVVLASHSPMVKWWVKPMMEYIQTTYGPPNQYIYAISRQTYFRSTTSPSATVPQLLQGAIDDINNQLLPDAVNEANRSDWVAFANQWQLPGGVTSYEGGPHFPSGGGTANLDNQILAHRDPGIKDVLKHNLSTAWWDIGGGLAMHFTLYSGYNRYGCWGLTDDLSNPDRNAKFTAMRELATEPLGVDGDDEFEAFKVFPNPTRREFRITGNEQGPVSLYILDLAGKQIWARSNYFPGEVVTLPDHFSPGLYVLRIMYPKPQENILLLILD